MKHEGNCSTADDSNGILLQPRKSSTVRLQIVPAQPKTITHLPKRPPVDLAFTDLTYKVREGRKNSEYIFISIILLSYYLIIDISIQSKRLSNCLQLNFSFSLLIEASGLIWQYVFRKLSIEKEKKIAPISLFLLNCCNISYFRMY